jgi:Zn-dependent protease
VDALTDCFEAWRVIRAGSREITEGLVAPEHRGPSASLRAALAGWPHVHYWSGPDHAELILVRPLGATRGERWLLHLALFSITAVCAMAAGATLASRYYPPVGSGIAGVLAACLRFFPDFLTQPLPIILSGWPFAVPLMAILLVHELGHYFAARRYLIDASPPYFLPIPPVVSPIGSLGAFLKLRSAVVDRRQLLDVGAAGPLAGFVVVLGVLAWGYARSSISPPGYENAATFITFGTGIAPLGDSILSQAFRDYFLPGAQSVHLSLPAFAGWAGALITGLNLLPLSQLDGGHVAYGLLGRRQTPLGLAALLGLLYLSQHWTPWLVWVALTLFVGGFRWTHPSVLCPERPVPASRRILGWICVLVFIVTFVPVPFAP